jgi:hypothetical protein
MTISVPQSLFDKYNEVCDWFLTDDNMSRLCTLVFPPKRTPCINCIKPVGNSTTNTYKHGGPASFTFGNCPLCGGSSFKEVEITDTIRLRIYFEKSAWIKIGESTLITDAEVMVIGFLSDVPKLRRAVEVLLVKDNREAEYRTVLLGKPYPHGFGKSRYFIAYLKGA